MLRRLLRKVVGVDLTNISSGELDSAIAVLLDFRDRAVYRLAVAFILDFHLRQ